MNETLVWRSHNLKKGLPSKVPVKGGAINKGRATIVLKELFIITFHPFDIFIGIFTSKQVINHKNVYMLS